MLRSTVLFLLVAVVVNVTMNLVIWKLDRAEAGECVAGDVTGDGRVSLSDPLRILEYMFNDGDAPVACAGTSDFSDDEIATLQDIAACVSVIDVEDPNDDTITYKTMLLSECNLQIVNGLGATNGDPDDPGSWDPDSSEVNGLGNIIIGYNSTDPDGDMDNDRTGSHNLVLGARCDDSGFGGVLGGTQNTISGPWCSVIGGLGNEASSPGASVLGGVYGTASGSWSTISGGLYGSASGTWSTVSGGISNTASGDASAVSGGRERSATGADDWAAGSLSEDQ